MAQKIYLDNSHTTRPSERAIAAALPFYTEKWGSSSQPHQMGEELYPSIDEAYQSIFQLLGAFDSAGFVFCSSGQEAINHVLLATYFDITRETGKNQYISINTEEAPILMGIGRLESLGCIGKMLDVDANGLLNLDTFKDALTPRVALVSLSWASGLTGVLQPIEDIAEICQEKGVLLHVDASHVIGKLFFELSDIPCDFVSFNGETFHAPRGTGGLYIAPGRHLSPFILGGIEQSGLRAGNLNTPLLIALGVASKEALESREFICTETARLRNLLEEKIVSGYKEAKICFQDQIRTSTTTTLLFEGIVNEALLYSLHRQGVFASIGGGSSQQLSLILSASKIPKTLAQSALSFTLSRETTQNEIEQAAKIICETANKMRCYSQDIQELKIGCTT